MKRRDVVLGLPGLYIASGVSADAGELDVQFPYGVASGDPTQFSIVLWTALSQGSRGVVHWWIRTANEGRVVRRGRIATDANAAYTVKVRVEGLKPGERYEYGFELGSATSRIGRTRTLPEAGTQPIRIALFACSRYSSGWFHAYRHAAEDSSIDLAVHLGDYIYEAPSASPSRTTGRLDAPDRELLTLEDYRLRHATYKRDFDLQALHAALPMLAIWDDHEVANDASRLGENTTRPAAWRRRLAAARQAYFEWMPIMAEADGSLRRQRRIGDLADIYLLDTRIEGRDAQLDPRDAAFAAEERQMLGDAQERWLRDGLAGPQRTVWTVLASSVVLSQLSWPSRIRAALDSSATSLGHGLLEERIKRSEAGLAGNPDAWDGYPAAQRRLLNMLEGHAGRTLVVSGDTHSSWLFKLNDIERRSLGWEVCVPSVTSEASLELVRMPSAQLQAEFRKRNPLLHYLDPSNRGYVVIELGVDFAHAEFRHVSSVVKRDARSWMSQRFELAAL